MIITSKTSGLVSLSSGNMLEGRSVSAKQALFTISGSEMAENNFSVKFSEAGNNFEKARADYERAKELSREKIISEKDLLATKTQYENARVVYDNLKNNFNESGQVVTSPLNGFIKQVFVKNGTYVTAGQPIITLAKNKTLLITADVPQKYAAILNTIQTANIRSITDNQLYTLDQLNGKVVSYGKSSNSGNFLIPVNLQIENNLRFTSGSFVEIYLITLSGTQALSVPNSSLLEEQGIYSVYVQINPELFEKREVIVGATDGKRSEILRGLSENERIVTKGAINIKLTQSTGTLDAHSGHVH
jgi:RND family efflux transporter MFP subunit